MSKLFPEIKGNFGFGCMRLPVTDGEVDKKQFCEMVDFFMENGFNYFDTAHGYLSGKSEPALKDCLTSRYPRDSYILTTKLSEPFIKRNEDIRPLFECQLKICGVDYFDFYLMHAINKDRFERYKKMRAFETAFELKKEGKIKHVGISFHDNAEVLECILSEYPEIEVVQIQFNYADFDDASVQSGKCYEVCRKAGKPVIIMEPVKGGNLVNLPKDAQKVFDELPCSNAELALRYAAGFDGVFMVLSGMGNMDMVKENVAVFKDFKPLDLKEAAAVAKVSAILKNKDIIPCTACKYCVDGCPQGIAIPDLFSCMNAKNVFSDGNSGNYYNCVNGKKASDCIKCGKCEQICPQHLEIRRLLEKAAKEFETK